MSRRSRPTGARRVKRTAAAVTALLLAAAGGLGYLMRAPFKGYASSSVLVWIPHGSSTSSILTSLEEGGVLRSRHAALLCLRVFRKGRKLKAGEYRIAGERTPLEVLDPILAGDVVTHRVTVPEGLTATEILGLFAVRGFGLLPEYERLLASPSLFPGVPPGAPSLEGFLFPDTYTVTRTMTANDVAAMLTGQFARRLPAAFASRASEQGLSVLEAVTLASIVEKETAVPAERPLVAAVYRNRLRAGMPLQADPTVIYALGRLGRPLRHGVGLLRTDLSVEDPYNTYTRPGLPPGPICSPGAAALEAALAPAPVPYLYFVARGDGSHRFAADYADQVRNVSLYRRGQKGAPTGAP